MNTAYTLMTEHKEAEQIPQGQEIRNDPSASLQTAQRMLRQALSEGDRRLELKCRMTIATAQRYLGNLEEAETRFREARRLAEFTGDQIGLAYILNGYGIMLSDAGRDNEAIEAYREAIAILEAGRESEPELMAVVIMNLGNQHTRADQPHKALEYFLKTVSYAEKSSNVSLHAAAVGNVGSVYFQLGDNEKALEYEMKALRLFEIAGNRAGVHSMLGGIGLIHVQRGDPGPAKQCLDAALDFAIHHSIPYEELIARHGLAVVHRLTGSYDEAIAFDRKALDIAVKFGFERWELDIRSSLAGYYAGIGDFETAESLACYCIDPSRNAGAKVLQEAHSVLSRIFEARDDIPKAFYHYKKAAILGDESFGLSDQQRVSHLHEKFERQAAENEKEILRLQAAALEREVEFKAREAASLATHLLQRRELLEKVRSHLLTINGTVREQALDELIGMIDTMLRNSGNDWEIFERQFHDLSQGFIRQLAASYPRLTPTELKIASLLRINCSTKDMAGILSISQNTVNEHRASIRKKIGLAPGLNLTSFLTALAAREA